MYGPRRATRESRESGARLRRAALRPAEHDGGLQRHQRELTAQLGARRRQQTVPEPRALAERALQRARDVSELAADPTRLRPQTVRCPPHRDRTTAALETRCARLVLRAANKIDRQSSCSASSKSHTARMAAARDPELRDRTRPAGSTRGCRASHRSRPRSPPARRAEGRGTHAVAGHAAWSNPRKARLSSWTCWSWSKAPVLDMVGRPLSGCFCHIWS